MLTSTGCRKGSRICEFPASSSSAKKIKTGEARQRGDGQDDGFDKLESIKDESEEDCDQEEDESMPPPKSSQKREKSERSRTASLSDGAPLAASCSRTSSTYEDYSQSPDDSSHIDTPLLPIPHRQPPFGAAQTWKKLRPKLRPEIEKYLQFQHDEMTHYHYLFKIDSQDFVHCELIEMALQFEPLLHAVVAFAAYHHAVRIKEEQPNFQVFWKFYCKSIISLRKHLATNNQRDDSVILTVLQLATFEEYMGDWTNLANHHKAAHGILTTHYSKEEIVKTDRGQKIFDWFARLDVISGLMAVRDVSLDRSWMAYAHDYLKEQIDSDGENSLEQMMEYFQKGIALIGHDIAHTFAHANIAMGQPGFSIDSVLEQSKVLDTRLHEIRRSIQKLNNPALAIIETSNKNSHEEPAFTADVPLFRGRLWPLNFVWIDWYGILLLLRNQSTLAISKARSMMADPSTLDPKTGQFAATQAELTNYAKTQCQIYNAIAESATAPKGAILSCYAALGLSTVFLPRAPPISNDKYTMWARRQLANIEKGGYVWPPHFRKEMAKLWNDPSILDWWLPNKEGKSPILSVIREIVEDRIVAAIDGPDDGRGDLREIKGLFEKMELGDPQHGSHVALDLTSITSNAEMQHVASMVSSPEDASSSGSAPGLSPRSTAQDVSSDRQRGRIRQSSRSSLSDASYAQREDGRMKDIWEEEA